MHRGIVSSIVQSSRIARHSPPPVNSNDKAWLITIVERPAGRVTHERIRASHLAFTDARIAIAKLHMVVRVTISASPSKVADDKAR